MDMRPAELGQYSMHEHQRKMLEEDMRRDTEVIEPGQYDTPYPGVSDSYVVLDLAQAPEAAQAGSTHFTVDPSVVKHQGGSAALQKEGEGSVFQMYVSGSVWIPDVLVAKDWDEYWLCMDDLGSHYAGMQRQAKAVVQMTVATAADTEIGGSGHTRSRLTPAGLGQTIPRPVSMKPMRISIATPAGPVTFPQMRFTVNIAYNGTVATLSGLPSDHGILATDLILPLSGFLYEDYPQGVDAGTPGEADGVYSVPVVSSRPSGASETNIDIIVAYRWIRIPLHFRGLVSRTTNFTAP